MKHVGTIASRELRSLFVSLQELNKGARRPEGVPETKFKKIGILGGGGFMVVPALILVLGFPARAAISPARAAPARWAC